MMEKCCLCGLNTAEMQLSFSENFNDYGFLLPGGSVCKLCYSIAKNPAARRSHWIITSENFQTLDKNGLLNMLHNPPAGSLIYIKSGGKKLTFLRALRFRSSSRMVALCGEDEGAVLVQRERLSIMLHRAEEALKVLQRKKSLLCGCSAWDWTAHRELCVEVEKYRGDPVWRMLVRAI